MRILIVGKKSRIALFLKKFLTEKFHITSISYSNIIKTKLNYFNKFDCIINCTSNKKYINKKYNIKNDHDYQIVKKIVNLNILYIFLSSRKIYKSKKNCKETDSPKPISHYSINKLITEKKLTDLIKKKLLILRISNVIGYNNIISDKKLHNTFIDIFFQNIKRGFIIKNNNLYKDFISAKKLCNIIGKLIKIKATGIFNISTGKKIYLNDIIKWLNFYNQKNYKIIINNQKNLNKDCFYLNNNKVIKITKIKIKVTDLKNECMKISKEFFKNKII